jgi:hypothetical protein
MKHINDLYRLQYNSECDGRTGNHQSGLDFGDWVNTQEPIGIEPEQINFESWLKITSICNCWKNVASSKWIQMMNREYLETIKLERWEEMSRSAELSIGWAIDKYKEFRK